MLVELKKIEPFMSGERGSSYQFIVAGRDHVMVLNRKTGTTSGNHYHPGNTKSKSPESFYLVKGKIRLLVKDIKTRQEETYEIEENSWFTIPANVFHSLTALTDITLLEFNFANEDFSNDVVK